MTHGHLEVGCTLGSYVASTIPPCFCGSLYLYMLHSWADGSRHFGRCSSGIVGQLALSEAVMSAVVSFSGFIASLTFPCLGRVASVLVTFPMCALNLTPRVIP